MPTLPTLEVTQSQFDILVAAFPGTTAAEKTASYRAWLVNQLIDFVETTKAEQLREDANASVAKSMQDFRATIPPKVAFPPL